MDGREEDLVPIRRFAGLTGISANTLRRYDELGLLSPAFTDPFTGYRLYSIDQLDTGILVRLLRDLDVPLSEVRQLVKCNDEQLRTLLVHHRERIVERHAELGRIVARIDAALDHGSGPLPYEVELIVLEPRWVISRRAKVCRRELDEMIDRCLEELEDGRGQVMSVT